MVHIISQVCHRPMIYAFCHLLVHMLLCDSLWLGCCCIVWHFVFDYLYSILYFIDFNLYFFFFFFHHKTAYEMRIIDWISDVCSSDLIPLLVVYPLTFLGGAFYSLDMLPAAWRTVTLFNPVVYLISGFRWTFFGQGDVGIGVSMGAVALFLTLCLGVIFWVFRTRSEEHTSELQSLMRISYAVFCLNKKQHDLMLTFTQPHADITTN